MTVLQHKRYCCSFYPLTSGRASLLKQEKPLKPLKIRLSRTSQSVPDAIRTHDLSLRRRTLYPAELLKHVYDFAAVKADSALTCFAAAYIE